MWVIRRIKSEVQLKTHFEQIPVETVGQILKVSKLRKIDKHSGVTTKKLK